MTRTIAVLLVALTGASFADRIAPRPVFGRVIKLELTGGSAIVTAGTGSDAGVTRDARCTFVNAKHEPVARDCIIIRVDKRTTVIKTQAVVDHAELPPEVKFDVR